MAEKTGTLQLSDLMAARFTNTNAAAFGLDDLADVVQRDLETHNALMEEALTGGAAPIAERSTDRQRLAGTSTRRELVELDEYGRAPTKKTKPGQTVGFPLKRYGAATGWTRDWMLKASVVELARKALEVQQAHRIKVLTEMKRALFVSANYNFADDLEDGITLAVKRLVNADSALIADGPNGEVFDGATHTHYTAAATLVDADLLAAVNLVVEHGHGGSVKLAIARADEAAVSALGSFKAYVDVRLTPGTEADKPLGNRLNPSRLDNRAIGLFGAAEVWVKPWAIANYALIWDSSDMLPLVMREEEQDALRGLQLIAEIDAHPMTAEYWEARFGFGVWNRTNGAIHQFSNGTYQDPTI